MNENMLIDSGAFTIRMADTLPNKESFKNMINTPKSIVTSYRNMIMIKCWDILKWILIV